MKYIITLLLLLTMLAIPSAAERGIVLNSSGFVQYKFDTNTLPTLEAGEWILLMSNINDIQKYAFWNGTVFINPLPYLEPEEKRTIKDKYLQTMSEIESAKDDRAIIRNQTTMTEIQQTNNIRKLADYEYKIFDILGAILRFLKLLLYQ